MQIYNFNWVDYSIIGIVLVSVLISLVRGFVREALSLISWILAFWVALKFCHLLEVHLTPYINHDTARLATSFLILFIITLIITAMVGYIIAQLLDRTGLSGTDRLLGTIFGFARGVLLTALLLLLARMTPLPNDPAWHQAELTPRFVPLEKWLVSFLPHDLDYDLQYIQALPQPKHLANASGQGIRDNQTQLTGK